MTQKQNEKREKALTLSDFVTLKEMRTMRNKKSGQWLAGLLSTEDSNPLVEVQGLSKNEAIRALFHELAKPHRYLTHLIPIVLESEKERVVFWQQLDGQFCYGFLNPGEPSPRVIHREGTDRVQAERAMRRHFADCVWSNLPRIEWEKTHGTDDPYVPFDPKHYAHDIAIWETHWLSPYIQDADDQHDFTRSVAWQCAHRWALIQGYTKTEAHCIASEHFDGVGRDRHLALGNPVMPNKYRRYTRANQPMVDNPDE